MHIMTANGWRSLLVKTVNHNEAATADPQLDFMKSAGYSGYLLAERRAPGVFRRNTLAGRYKNTAANGGTKMDQFKFKRMLFTGEGI